jgi:hypothetical protein
VALPSKNSANPRLFPTAATAEPEPPGMLVPALELTPFVFPDDDTIEDVDILKHKTSQTFKYLNIFLTLFLSLQFLDPLSPNFYPKFLSILSTVCFLL